ncbi:tyrosine-protein phosphatase [Protaetiibacter larvae]|uniref:Tyrosine-protein phosphatase n=1 Tax=Protaetiibacter larvae TaxID=2592654 RepID=A0A5C1Y9G5_9MICO|nr:tyrosine-protein phosphatase [Protaetiibacter larvae]QEO09925.1 tyrosine-protein phosphatase [Protaetiibacter larvae]
MSLDPTPHGTRIELPGTYNFRPVAPGLIREARLYRSDSLHRLAPAGRRALAELDVRLVIDLRSDFDRRFGGRDRLRGVGAEYRAIPIHGAGRGTDPSTLTIRSVYRSILENHRAQLGETIRAVADADGAVVVHCTAGKDRTGLVVALILRALDVEPERVVADYALSEGNLAGEWSEAMLRRVARYRPTIGDELRELLTGSPAPALLDTFAWIDAEHGSVQGYLETAGVDAGVVDRLHRRLDR